ncbi:MAG TPA: ABC transporter substrate-binding protein [Baekduia sp.]|uniref:ABC transporter substrate-binding protein n=1 Tax=Baekduia sp. TaxID=2600305 RepID=UPI002D785CFE|nr:ABC transporter substrate-binding protein [Baekduia sp.]HET6509696.1 ABC transporter substrate-binding protein [Baekduia sp.]
MHVTRRMIALAAPVVALALAACGGATSPTGAPGDGAAAPAGGGGGGHPTINVAFNTSIATLDPAYACEQFGYTIIRNTYDQLVAPAPGGQADGSNVRPMLATRWTSSADKRVWTFTLRTGVRFASGNPVTARDVEYSLRRLLDLDACAAFVVTGGLTGNITKVRAVDDTTVQITLAKADPIFLETMSSRAASIIDSKLLDQHGGAGKQGAKWLATHTAGSGPFTLASYEPDSEIVLAPRDDYWRGAPKPGEVDIKIVTDPATLKLLTSSRQVDMAYGIQPKDLASLRAAGGKVLSFPSQFVTYIGLVADKKPLDDVRVRQALSYAFPAQDIIEAFGYGQAKAFSGPIPPAMPFYPNLPGLGHDPAKAKRLLAEAGASHLHLTLVVQSGQSTHEQIATVLQDAYRDVGVTLTVQTLGSSAFTDKVYNYKAQAFIIDDGPTVNDPGYLLSYQARCGDSFNWVRYCDKGVDAQLAQARFEADAARRGDLYKRIDARLIQDAPYIEVMAKNHTIVVDPQLKGYTYYDDQTAHFFDITK